MFLKEYYRQLLAEEGNLLMGGSGIVGGRRADL